MLALVIILSLLIILALASLLWGADSRDSINSAEWERRRNTLYPTHHS